MPVGLQAPQSLLPIQGIRLSAIVSGIKKNQQKDLVLIELAKASECVAMFTQNRFCAAPVTLAKKHLKENDAVSYLLINSGNANAGTGQQGMQDAVSCCQQVAENAGCQAESVLPFSTGVIGENLPVDKISQSLPDAFAQLSEDNWLDAGQGIMTTDTCLKGMSEQVSIDGTTITVTGLSKGSGMIQPNMATMLAYIATDAAVTNALLQQCIEYATERSFNAITVDSDTSTNDACVLMSTGQAQNSLIDQQNDAFFVLRDAITRVFTFLAQAIVRDAEGATKFITLNVENAHDVSDAKKVAYTVAHSPLVKTAMFASDPNWGRILAAVGRSGVEFDIDKIQIYLGDVCIVSEGGRNKNYTEEQGQAVMNQDEITVRILLNSGSESTTVWTSDLSHEYVTINSEYRS